MKTLLKLDLFQWFFVIAITVSFLLMQNQFVWLKEFPKEFIFPLSAIFICYFKFWNGVGC